MKSIVASIGLGTLLWAGSGVAASYRPQFVSVSGHWVDGEARVVWATAEQTGTAAFRVWRVANGGDVLLDESWIPAAFEFEGHSSYHVVDRAMGRGDRAEYRIEELRLDGRVGMWGPWAVMFEEPSLPPARAAARLLATAEDPVAGLLAGPETGPALKIPVRRHDLYAVSFEAIAAGLGLTPSQVADMALADPPQLRMHTGGQPVAFLPEAAEQRILFYGWPVAHRYTRDNIFWIEPGLGVHMATRPPDDLGLPSGLTHASTVRFQEYVFLNPDHYTVLPDNFYFWERFIGNHATWGQRTLPVSLEGYAGGDVRMTLNLEGWNQTAKMPDHRAEVYFNDVWLGSVAFDDLEIVLPEFTIPAHIVRPAGNELKITAILQAGHTASYFALKYFEVAYTRHYAPAAGAWVASDGGHARLSADLFTDPVVLDVTQPHAPVRVALADGTIPAGYSWAVTPDSAWVFRERVAITPATPVPGGSGSWMRSSDNTVDYLIIAPREFEAPALSHAAYRAGQGLRTAVALYEDICDQFAAGLNTPDSIRDLLRFAHANWAVAPPFVLLAGWGHFDYFGVMSSARNYLPPLLGTDSATLRPADGLFADLTGDEVPDLALGRLPVQSVEQFQQYLDKLQAYETAGPQAAHLGASFFADNAEGSDNFSLSNEQFAVETARRYSVSLKSLDTDSVSAMRLHIAAALSGGHGMVHYTGHGSYQQLAGENLLSVADVNGMAPHPPVPAFLSLTCYIGRFDHYASNQRSLGEALVLKPAGGALAVYAPSGLSFNSYIEPFGVELHRQHALQRFDTLGLAIGAAREAEGPQAGIEAVSRRTYNLLGDPALKLRGGEGGTAPDSVSSFALWRWERFSIPELGDPSISAWDAVPEGEDENNLTAYAYNGRGPVLDIQKPGAGEDMLGLEWNERAAASDISIRLLWTDALNLDWNPMPHDVTVHRWLTEDSSVCRVRADLPIEAPARFFRLEVVEE